MDSQQSVKQGDFGKEFTITDHILALNQIIMKTREFGREIWLLYTDFNKAFDSIYHYMGDPGSARSPRENNRNPQLPIHSLRSMH